MYDCRIGTDGSLRFDAIPPGVYELRVTVTVKDAGPATQSRSLHTVQEVTVPEMPGKPGGQPFNLGKLNLEFKGPP